MLGSMPSRPIRPIAAAFVLSLLAVSGCSGSSTTRPPDGPSTTSAGGGRDEGAGAGATRAHVAAGCKLGGCGSELCLDESAEDMASICIARPEDVCYRSARCEPQAGGGCGWTQTDELLACLANPPQE